MREMRDTIRCCIACILPCGALDVIRIVHANGRVEEISGTVSAGEIMKAYPKHVIRKLPSACPVDGGGVAIQKPIILPPNAELEKGTIYFLMPVATVDVPEKARSCSGSGRRRRKKKEVLSDNSVSQMGGARGGGNDDDKEKLLANERYLSEIMKEKASTQRDRRRGRVTVWRPHLESITEDDF